MKLYGVNLSPFFERTMMLLDHKGQMDLVEPARLPGGMMKTPEHLAMNPLGKIPFLELDCGTILLESQVIAEYVDQVSDGDLMVPANKKDAAVAQLIARTVDMYLWTGIWAVIDHYMWKNENPDAVKKAIDHDIPTALDVLERYVHGGEFAVAGDWSYADFALVPVMFQYTTILPKVGITDFGDRPNLTAWWQAMKDKPLVQRCHDRMQKSLEAIMSRRK